MNIVRQNVDNIVPFDNPLGHIEICARTCYKSEDKIKEGSAKKMVGALVRSGHTSTLEHYIVAVQLCDLDLFLYLARESWKEELLRYLKFDGKNLIISGNLRAWRQVMNLPYYKEMCHGIASFYDCFEIFHGMVMPLTEDFLFTVLRYNELPMEHRWYTFKITTDRAIANEIVRHRKFGYSQESTRFCNYHGEIVFCEPTDLNVCEFIEMCYASLVDDEGVKPEDARGVLPLDTKTEICMTGYDSDFRWFVDLRYFNKFGKAHHKIREIAKEVLSYLT